MRTCCMLRANNFWEKDDGQSSKYNLYFHGCRKRHRMQKQKYLCTFWRPAQTKHLPPEIKRGRSRPHPGRWKMNDWKQWFKSDKKLLGNHGKWLENLKQYIFFKKHGVFSTEAQSCLYLMSIFFKLLTLP